jgi:hypothetical protein
MEIILHYVLPNILLFTSIYAIAKLCEFIMWEMILFISDPCDDHKIGRFLDKIGVDNSTQQ